MKAKTKTTPKPKPRAGSLQRIVREPDPKLVLCGEITILTWSIQRAQSDLTEMSARLGRIAALLGTISEKLRLPNDELERTAAENLKAKIWQTNYRKPKA